MKKLPKQIFVKIDGDKPDEFYNAADKAEHLVNMGETVQIGRYELVELAEAIAVSGRSKSWLERHTCAWCDQTLWLTLRHGCAAMYEPCEPSKKDFTSRGRCK